jgi:hypothetical protein
MEDLSNIDPSFLKEDIYSPVKKGRVNLDNDEIQSTFILIKTISWISKLLVVNI